LAPWHLLAVTIGTTTTTTTMKYGSKYDLYVSGSWHDLDSSGKAQTPETLEYIYDEIQGNFPSRIWTTRWTAILASR